MKKILIILLLISFKIADAQEIIKRERINTVNASLIGNIFNINSFYYVACSSAGGTSYIIRFDSNFENPEIIKTFKFDTEYLSSSYNYFHYERDTITAALLYRKGNVIFYPIIVKIDLEGNELSSKIIDEELEYQIFSNQALIHFKFIDKNNFFAFYSSKMSGYISNMYSIYIDNGEKVLFNLIEQELSDNAKIDRFNNAYYDDGLYCVDGFYNIESDSTKIFFMKFEESGELVFEKGLSFDNKIPITKFEKQNEKLYLTGTRFLGYNEYDEKEISYGFTIADTNGNILNQNEYSFKTYNNISAFNKQKYIRTRDGGFLIAVSSALYHPEKPNEVYRPSYDSYVVKTDSIGNMEWHTKIETKSREEHINYMTEDSDGNFVVFNRVIPTDGTTSELEDDEKYMEIIKIQSPYSSVENTLISDAENMLHPNPASDYIEIYFDRLRLFSNLSESEIVIYDVLGERVYSTKVTERSRSAEVRNGGHFDYAQCPEKIDISHLPRGVYFVRVGNKVEKFVKM